MPTVPRTVVQQMTSRARLCRKRLETRATAAALTQGAERRVKRRSAAEGLTIALAKRIAVAFQTGGSLVQQPYGRQARILT